ncbi:MAG: hypothetical protein ATN35_10330 [Epulopiscium sp. Nele67-Bin004]|nr:MAG: hypothetical protein ATN35_10330 [Epulopiscium sp. Nele67-Bin004]
MKLRQRLAIVLATSMICSSASVFATETTGQVDIPEVVMQQETTTGSAVVYDVQPTASFTVTENWFTTYLANKNEVSIDGLTLQMFEDFSAPLIVWYSSIFGDIDHIPEEFKYLSHILNFNMGGNFLGTDADNLKYLTSATKIGLGIATDLESVSFIRYLGSALEYFSLSNADKIRDFSPISYATNLTELRLMNSDIDDFSFLTPLQKLETLLLSGTGDYGFVPDNVFVNVPNLDSLTLPEAFKTIPAGLETARDLRSYSHAGLTEVADFIFDMENIYFLTFSDSTIRHLPENFYTFVIPNTTNGEGIITTKEDIEGTIWGSRDNTIYIDNPFTIGENYVDLSGILSSTSGDIHPEGDTSIVAFYDSDTWSNFICSYSVNGYGSNTAIATSYDGRSYWRFIGKISVDISDLNQPVLSGITNVEINLGDEFNPRTVQVEENIIRGNFFDYNGTPLTETIDEKRYYVYNSRYAHSVGYLNFGEYGLEKELHHHLFSPTYSFSQVSQNLFFDEKFVGRDIYLTLDNDLQKLCQDALEEYKGAIVIIEPSTGQVKAMYCSPSFNPNTLDVQWSELVADTDNTPLLNRATQGLYPPGSIYKIVPTLALMEYYPDEWQDITYNCTGSIWIDDENCISCYNNEAHGDLTLDRAFALSCNTYFINLLQYITPKQLENVSKQLFFGQSLPTSINVAPSHINIVKTDDFSQAATYMGQGKTLVTPFHMAMLASAIANDGVLMSPYWVNYIEDKSGNQVEKNLPQYHSVLIEEGPVKALQYMMEQVVQSGTATMLSNIDGVVGVKTGTAQNESAYAHSWVMGYIKGETNLAFAVIVEQQEKVATSIINYVLENNRNY